MSDKGYYTASPASEEYDDADYIEDLEYKVMIIKLEGPPDFVPMGKEYKPIDEKIENLLNTGWNLYHEIVCPPFVILFFSKEREGNE